MTADNELKIGGVLLAAGGSSRMGRAKQMIEIDGVTLIKRAALSLVHSECIPNVAVLGAAAGACKREIVGLDIEIVVNDNWASGMSSSLKAGLSHLLRIEPTLDAVVVTLCDQPLITSEIINEFVGEYRRIRPQAIAAEYNGVSGVPALFARGLFDRVLRLEGDKGAREVLRSKGTNLVTLSVPSAAFDIDSPHDLRDGGEEAN